MRIPYWPLAAAVFMASCGSEPKPAAQSEPAAPVAPAPKPADETRRFPMTDLVDTQVIEVRLMDKDFMPGGTLAHYKKGKKTFEMFVAKFPSATGSAVILPDWRKALENSKLIPSFGGYFGQDHGRPVFVFAKGRWLAGVAGLPEKEADAEARVLAARLD